MSSSQPPSREKKPLGFDELIAIVVAFGTIGAIFFWVTGRNPDRLRTANWQFPAVFSQPAVTPESPRILTPAAPIPSPSPSPAPVAPLPEEVVTPIPLVPPVSVAPKQPIGRSTQAPATTKPKATKAKVGPVKYNSVKTGYLKGYPNNEFRPDKQVPRVEVIAALASGLNLKPSTKATKTLQVYKDRKKVPKWALDKVAAATEAGIVVNHPKRQLLQPNRTATRAEVAAMIYQAMAKQGKVPAKPSQYVVRL